MAVKFLLYNRWYDFLGEIASIRSAETDQEINGIDSLTMAVDDVLSYGDRIVYYSGCSWSEMVVTAMEQVHSGGETFSYTCTASAIWDLRAQHVREIRAQEINAKTALTVILAETNWSVGQVDDFGEIALELSQMSSYQCLLEICKEFGCEFEPVITVDAAGNVKRRLNLVTQRGQPRPFRYEYSHNLAEVKKIIEDQDVVTAVYAYGSTVTDSQGNPRTSWGLVENNNAKELWGIPDGEGGKRHVFGFYQGSTYAIPKAEAQAYLETHCNPAITYEISSSVASISEFELGDTVQVVDKEFTPELRLQPRVAAIKKDLLTERITGATFGNVTSILPEYFVRAAKTERLVNSIFGASSSLDSINSAISELNDRLKKLES